MINKRKYEIHEAILRLLNNNSTPEQFTELQEWLGEDEKALAYYCEFIRDYSLVKGQVQSKVNPFELVEFDQELWQALAQEEKKAPVLELPTDKPRPELIQKIVYPPREKHKISKLAIFSLAVNAAAILFIVLFLKFAPTKPVEVATLSDDMNAKWADVDASMRKGVRLSDSGQALMLREGLAELTFDNNAKAVIEGPAEFQILTEDQIKLNYGRLYAIVPRKAIGFTVKTLSSKIVDLGTEFGVRADYLGGTSLHVVKGKTVLIADNKSDEVSVEVGRGQAKKVSTETRTISDIPCETHFFAREINSANNLVWRGQTKVNLADIVGGGNGFGTGRECLGIDPASGKLVDRPSMSSRTQETSQFALVAANPYIDGVFVPLGGDSQQVVTSEGDVFKECPKTDGRYWIEITNKPVTGLQNNAESIQLAQLNGIEYGTERHSAIMMHANSGITFDLQAIRSIIPNSRITNFTSSCGLSETLKETALQNEASAELWVLIDGQPRQSVHVDFEGKSNAFLTVNIDDNDRFLTLVSCSDWNSADWTLYGDPVLELKLND